MVKLDEKTRLSLQFNNFWAIIISLVAFTFTVSSFYFGFVKRMDEIHKEIMYIREDIADIRKDFKSIHDDVVQNHDDIIILKGLAGNR